ADRSRGRGGNCRHVLRPRRALDAPRHRTPDAAAIERRRAQIRDQKRADGAKAGATRRFPKPPSADRLRISPPKQPEPKESQALWQATSRGPQSRAPRRASWPTAILRL